MIPFLFVLNALFAAINFTLYFALTHQAINLGSGIVSCFGALFVLAMAVKE